MGSKYRRGEKQIISERTRIYFLRGRRGGGGTRKQGKKKAER